MPAPLALPGLRPRGEALGGTGVYGALFALAALSFSASIVLQGQLGLAGKAMAVLGSATCAWSWLVVRGLFRPSDARRERWPVVVVVMLVLAHAAVTLDGMGQWPGSRLVANLFALSTSAMLLLAAFEPIRGWHMRLAKAERAFRALFTAGYLAILLVAVVWVDGAPDGSLAARHGQQIKAICALLALAGIGAAVGYRARHPLRESPGHVRREVTVEDAERGERIVALLRDHQSYLDSELRVSGLARMLGEPEYRVTRSITGALGFRNFNDMVNRWRIEEAMRRLADPALGHLPILTIALDCGFGSIGAFNRAFRAQVGTTPREFRARRATGTAAR